MTTEFTIINSGSNGFGMNYPTKADKKELVIKHNAGFFSCCTIALQDIVIYHRHHKGLPDHVDRSSQYRIYMHEPMQNLIPFFWNEQDFDIPFTDWYELSHDNVELQFSDYRKLDFEKSKPFMDKFFTPSQHVLDIVKFYEEKYQIDYEHTCGVFYRGNDKNRECKIAPYNEFLDKTQEVRYSGLNGDASEMKFFVLPDETEFLEAFQFILYPNITITPEETPHMRKKDSAIPFELPTVERAEYAAKFLAAVIVMSKCKHLITHSGNCGMWSVLFRGNTNNVHQWQNDKWIY
jgi:hypothetical protein